MHTEGRATRGRKLAYGRSCIFRHVGHRFAHRAAVNGVYVDGLANLFEERNGKFAAQMLSKFFEAIENYRLVQSRVPDGQLQTKQRFQRGVGYGAR